ncbi:MAG: hypothetical protein PVJ09_04075 [Candidatus Woesebacteria bacterium]|jgi:hypothetical protein
MNFNAYRPSHRNRFLLVKHEILTREEFIIFELCLDQMGFDSRNSQYKKVKIDFKQFASCLGYSSTNSIRTKITKLTTLGILIPTQEPQTYEIFNAERYIATTKKWGGQASQFQQKELNQSFEQIIQNIAPNFQITEAKVQSFEQTVRNCLEIDSPRTLNSSKVNSKVNSPVVTTLPVGNQRTMADYQRIHKEEGFQYLPPEDMKWLDEHITADERTIL